MNIEKIKSVIDRVFDNNEDINPNTSGEIRGQYTPEPVRTPECTGL